jgi:hypothetical protein
MRVMELWNAFCLVIGYLAYFMFLFMFIVDGKNIDSRLLGCGIVGLYLLLVSKK